MTEDSTRKKLVLSRLIPVYPSMGRMRDLRKATGMSDTTILNMLIDLPGVAEQESNRFCFISLEAKEAAQKKYEHILAECRMKDNGGDL